MKEIFDYVNAPIEWEQYNVSGVSPTGEGEELFKAAMESLKRNRVGLKGRFRNVIVLITLILSMPQVSCLRQSLRLAMCLGT